MRVVEVSWLVQQNTKEADSSLSVLFVTQCIVPDSVYCSARLRADKSGSGCSVVRASACKIVPLGRHSDMSL